jgi:hypothetical protein
MSQKLISNGEQGLDVRNAINENFAELYSIASGNLPIRILNATGNFIQAIPANAFVQGLSIKLLSGAPNIRIGTSPNGEEIMPDTVITGSQLILVQQIFDSAGSLYFTWTSGSGGVNIRIDVITDYN